MLRLPLCNGCRAFLHKATGQLDQEESAEKPAQTVPTAFATAFAELDEDYRLTNRKLCEDLPESEYQDEITRLRNYYAQRHDQAPKGQKELEKILDVFDHDAQAIWRSLHMKYGTLPLQVKVVTEVEEGSAVYYIVWVRHIERQLDYKTRTCFSEVHQLNDSLSGKVLSASASSKWEGKKIVSGGEIDVIQELVLNTLPPKSIKSASILQWAGTDFVEGENRPPLSPSSVHLFLPYLFVLLLISRAACRS
jgi:hypothetical protein